MSNNVTLVRLVSVHVASATEAVYTERFYRSVFNHSPKVGMCFKHTPTKVDIQIHSIWEAEELPYGVWDIDARTGSVKAIRF